MTKTSERIYLLDLLKLAALIAIQTLHTFEFVFFEDNFTFGHFSAFEMVSDCFARFFTLGGQILVGVVYLTFGLTQKSRTSLLKIALFALLGQLVLTLIFMDDGFFQGLEWDIYSFLFVTNLLLPLIPLRKRSSIWIILPSLLILLVPTTVWQEAFPEGYLYDILSGRKTIQHTASWALLPWFFHCALFLGAGAFIREHRDRFRILRSWEKFLLPILFLLSLPWVMHFHRTPVGPNYYHFNFNQPPWVYWPMFLQYVVWMRLAFVDQVQEKLAAMSFCRWVSGLMWSRYLGATYLVGVVYVGLMANYSDELRNNSIVLDLLFLGIMPVSEMVIRGFMRLTRGRKSSSLPNDSVAK